MEPGTIAQAELVVETGSLAGTRFLLDRPLVAIGRSENNDIMLEDEMASKSHCRIITQGDNYLVEDLGSSNGTIVNGQQVNSHMLSDGDKLYIGQTTLTFKKSAPAATAAAPATATSSRKKGIWIAVSILAALIVVTGIVVAVLFLVIREKDEIKPEVALRSPQQNQVVEIHLPVPAGVDIPVNVEASDNKGLDKVDVLVNDQVVKTFKASKARKDAKTDKALKQEDFSFNYHVGGAGDYAFRIKAYDWKGNTGEADPVAVKVTNGADVAAGHAYCQQIDAYITEFVLYKQKFNKVYTGAKNGVITYYEAAYAFEEIGDQRRSLRSRLGGTSPHPSFAAAHSLFDKQIACAIEADDYAVLWARDMQAYELGLYSVPDPNGYEKKIQYWSGQTQSAANAFGAEYNARRADQLGIGPGPNPNG
ncbi:MAG: FHA domain-containing protein [Actinobacteria bacterium]|nr:FHA domain-containing protein [Actinomycetota bacterium]MCG2819526.1 FHA domain-containing protein [Actinomycetes bacterium]MBU4217423.1 FHA domain-containing protein [Actinomycetota bacterium]MBU4358806.1 FHA domain-containing protein [Actinomycetota bacterium]MBU4392506.1 FHA domain-containing protein [Actinomycetota bacterium]